MKLIANLIDLTLAGLCLALVAGCASNAPRRPGGQLSKAGSTFDQRCVDAYNRGALTPAGCQNYYATRRSAGRGRPALINEPMPLPSLPSGSLGSGGLLGR